MPTSTILTQLVITSSVELGPVVNCVFHQNKYVTQNKENIIYYQQYIYVCVCVCVYISERVKEDASILCYSEFCA